jgi:hypothetical protein
MSTFRITGLDPERFRDLFGKSDEELAARGARRCIVDATPGYPDRVEMRDLEVGEKASRRPGIAVSLVACGVRSRGSDGRVRCNR